MRVQEGGVSKTYHLVPDGERKTVTDANKAEFVDLVVKWLLMRGISRQMEAFRCVLWRGLSAYCMEVVVSWLPGESVDQSRRGGEQ